MKLFTQSLSLWVKVTEDGEVCIFRPCLVMDVWILGCLGTSQQSLKCTSFLLLHTYVTFEALPFFKQPQQDNPWAQLESLVCPCGPWDGALPGLGPAATQHCPPSTHSSAQDLLLFPDWGRVRRCNAPCTSHWPCHDGEKASERPAACSACPQQNLPSPCLAQKVFPLPSFIGKTYSK